jgi:hypothetical protein
LCQSKKSVVCANDCSTKIQYCDQIIAKTAWTSAGHTLKKGWTSPDSRLKYGLRRFERYGITSLGNKPKTTLLEENGQVCGKRRHFEPGMPK